MRVHASASIQQQHRGVHTSHMHRPNNSYPTLHALSLHILYFSPSCCRTSMNVVDGSLGARRVLITWTCLMLVASLDSGSRQCVSDISSIPAFERSKRTSDRSFNLVCKHDSPLVPCTHLLHGHGQTERPRSFIQPPERSMIPL
jgi:hypothetical protein